MERSLFRYILRHSRSEQLVILLVVVLSQIFYFISLDIPKTIVNKAIQGKGFDSPTAAVHFLVIDFDWPGFLAPLGLTGHAVLFHGIALERIPYLIAITSLFLFMVLVNNAFKYQINTQKGRLGERMLRRLRFELLDRILRFPPSHLRRVKQAEMATMIKDEVEPLGGFIGDAFVQPAFLGGQALTALIFILGQSWWLGGVTVLVLALQIGIIPALRKPILDLGRRRQVTARQLAGRIAECVDGGAEIHVNDTSNFERAEISERLGLIYRIRFEIYQRKFAVKALNNLLAQVTPYLFYLIGGYLAITGRFDLGGLLAVINAYKDLPGPVKELIDWYQQLQDVQIKYEQVIEQFTPDGMLPGDFQAPQEVSPLAGSVALSNLVELEDGDRKVLDGITAEFGLNEHLAVKGPGGGGKEALALTLARLASPSTGSVRIAGRDLAQLPEAVSGRRISYVGQDVYLFPLSVRDNILYGLRHQPVAPPHYDEAAERRHERSVLEARRSGNPTFDINADWTDYAAAGATGPQDIDDRIIEMLDVVELEEDVYQFGLRGTIDPELRPDLAAQVIEARRELRGRLADPELAALVEPFDRDRYNRNMSIAENLLFGTPVGPTFAIDKLAGNDYLLEVLDEQGLLDDLIAIGIDIARTMVELFADLPPGSPYFEQFSFIDAEDLPDFRTLVQRIDKEGVGVVHRRERERFGWRSLLHPLGPARRRRARLGRDAAKLLALAFPYIEARHRLDQIDAALEERLLAARRAFAGRLPGELASAIEFYDESRYNAAASLQDNILFGRFVYGQAQAAPRIGRLITEVLTHLGQRRAVLEVGLDYPVGIAGKRLTAVQRQKVGLARGLIKRPDLIVINEATAVFDGTAQIRVLERILEHRRGCGLVWVLDGDDMARRLDRVLELQNGKVETPARPAEQGRAGTITHELETTE
jgi:putative ABC transport system ATP-binding protein